MASPRSQHPSHDDPAVAIPPNSTAIRAGVSGGTRQDGPVDDSLAEVLPLALAIAVSPLTIIPAILLLLSPRALTASASFLAGWVLGLAAAATAFTLVASFVELADQSPTWVSWMRTAFGVALIVLGIRQWLQRDHPKPPPAWMAAISSASPGRAFRLAITLAVANPKVLLLTAAAGLDIGAADLPASTTAVAIAVFTVVAALSVALPVLLYLVLGERIVGVLAAARTWLQRHNAAIMSAVFVIIGVVLTANGVSGLG
jgi:threonine/homoserine/homoserine lactone efflux protein